MLSRFKGSEISKKRVHPFLEDLISDSQLLFNGLHALFDGHFARRASSYQLRRTVLMDFEEKDKPFRLQHKFAASIQQTQ